MDHNKAKYFLQRINTILELHPDGLTSLDRDMVLEDIRKLYNTVLDPDANLTPIKKASVNTVPDTAAPNAPASIEPSNPSMEKDTYNERTIPKVEPIQETTQPVQHANENEVEEKEEKEKAQPISYSKDIIEEKAPPEVYVESNISSEPQPQNGQEQAAPVYHNSNDANTIVEERKENTVEYEYLFDIKIDGDLSGKLGNAKIEHLNSVLSINDKILYINQLFKGEAIPFQESLKKFQSFYTFEEAKSYASTELVEEFDWTQPDKKEVVQSFMKQVHRLY